MSASTGVVTRGPISRMLEREGALAFWLLVPTLALLTLFIAYPFVRGVWLSLTNSVVGVPGEFIGLKNFVKLWNDSIFRTAALNTIVYTGVTTVFKLALGLWLALLLNHHFRCKTWVRAFILLPFIIPTVLSTLAWKWMFDSTFSVFNWLFWKLSIINARINWLGDPELAMASISAVNIWRGMPFYAISLLAGLQTINQDLHEAAAIDGANRFQRFWYVTWPLILPVTMVVVLFSVIQTFADFQLVYVLTGGGPANARICLRPSLSDRHRHRAVKRRRSDLARHVPGAAPDRDLPALVHPQGAEIADDRRRQVEEVAVVLPADGHVHPRLAVPVLLDAGDLAEAQRRAVPAVNHALYSPFWTSAPTLDHVKNLLQDTLFGTWMWNTMLIALASTLDLAVLRRDRRLRAGAAALPLGGAARHRDLHHLPRAADAALHPARRHHPSNTTSATRPGR